MRKFRNPKLAELRDWLKEEAIAIREDKAELKETQRKGYAGSEMEKLHYRRQRQRHHHIAYCELLGRTRDQIENPRHDNLPDEYEIQKIKERYAEATVCPAA